MDAGTGRRCSLSRPSAAMLVNIAHLLKTLTGKLPPRFSTGEIAVGTFVPDAD
jgi:hypothetical protein